MSRLFPHTCDTKRDTAVGTNGRHSKTAHLSGVACLFVPMPSRAEIDNGFSVGTGFDVYFKDQTTDVTTGDQLVRSGATYNVRSVARYEVPRVGHLHALATREGAAL